MIGNFLLLVNLNLHNVDNILSYNKVYSFWDLILLPIQIIL